MPASSRVAWLMPLLWIAGLCLVAGWMAWRLYASGPEAEKQALSDGRAHILTLTPSETAEAPEVATVSGTLADSDTTAFPPKAPGAAAPEAFTPAPGQSLAALDPALTEQTEQGPLPKLGADGTKPWQVYAHPFTRTGSRPVIAILITEIGLSKAESDTALRLPAEVTISLSPYAASPKLWGDAARALGHELLIGLPLQPAEVGTDDPGPHALYASNTPETNGAHLRWVLTRAAGIIGVSIASEERFCLTARACLPTLQLLAKRGLMLAAQANGPAEAEDALAQQAALPLIRADVQLDDAPEHEAIGRQLAALENIALRRGYALGTGKAYPVTLKTVQEWAQALEKKGIILAPVSALARMKFS